MAEISQNTMAKVAATMSWRDLENEERKAEGLPPLPQAVTEPEVVGGVYGNEPRMVVPDAVDEDYENAAFKSGLRYRAGWPQRDDAYASRGLIVGALLVFVAVAALLGVAFAV
jgi:hypothetical protein